MDQIVQALVHHVVVVLRVVALVHLAREPVMVVRHVLAVHHVVVVLHVVVLARLLVR